MSDWKYTLNLKQIWQDDRPAEQKGEAIAAKIKAMIPATCLDWYNNENYDAEIVEIIESFENVTGYDDYSPIQEFDMYMERLYDWGDQEVSPYRQFPVSKMCWISTFF